MIEFNKNNGWEVFPKRDGIINISDIYNKI